MRTPVILLSPTTQLLCREVAPCSIDPSAFNLYPFMTDFQSPFSIYQSLSILLFPPFSLKTDILHTLTITHLHCYPSPSLSHHFLLYLTLLTSFTFSLSQFQYLLFYHSYHSLFMPPMLFLSIQTSCGCVSLPSFTFSSIILSSPVHQLLYRIYWRMNKQRQCKMERTL
uniref:Uncharacterized protein n=1 Tax=Octopus bimaculoides TaxID=37653 RepID=A0A0L8GT01_OCTBM